MRNTKPPCDEHRKIFGPIIECSPPLDTTLLKAFGIRGVKKDLWPHLKGMPGEFNATCMRYWIRDHVGRLKRLPYRIQLDLMASNLQAILVSAKYVIPEKEFRQETINKAKKHCLSSDPEIKNSDASKFNDKVDLIIDVLKKRTCVEHRDFQMLMQRDFPEIKEQDRFDYWMRKIAQEEGDLSLAFLADTVQDRLSSAIRCMPPTLTLWYQAQGKEPPLMGRSLPGKCAVH